jgi:hypothetical protein
LDFQAVSIAGHPHRLITPEGITLSEGVRSAQPGVSVQDIGGFVVFPQVVEYGKRLMLAPTAVAYVGVCLQVVAEFFKRAIHNRLA